MYISLDQKKIKEILFYFKCFQDLILIFHAFVYIYPFEFVFFFKNKIKLFVD
jgi:hypothetical protein